MGMEAEIGETIVIVSPMLSDGFYGVGDKFKVLAKDDYGVKVSIQGSDD